MTEKVVDGVVVSELNKNTCGVCGSAGDVQGAGSASGRIYFRCPSCGANWSVISFMYSGKPASFKKEILK